MKQTALDWLLEQMSKEGMLPKLEDYHKAKQMEAEQTKGGELATFKASSRTELSDEVLKKTLEEINKQPMTFVPNEISDEEIKNFAKEHILYNDSKRQWVIEGMKLYREQLKQK